MSASTEMRLLAKYFPAARSASSKLLQQEAMAVKSKADPMVKLFRGLNPSMRPRNHANPTSRHKN